ncbi:hypothetical protein GCM10028807_36310 [Spirosoma daeguense]
MARLWSSQYTKGFRIRLPKKVIFDHLNERLTLAYELLSRTVLILIVVLFLYIFGHEYFRDNYTIEPFDVPKAWIENGMNGKVAAQQVLKGTKDIIEELEGNHETFGVAISAKEDIEEGDIEIGGFNLRSLFRYITMLTGKEQRHIQGHIVQTDSLNYLTINITGAHTIQFHSPKQNVDSLFHSASIYTLQQINPYALGRFFISRKEYSKAIEQISYIRTHFGLDYQMTALHLWGALFREQYKLTEAQEKYDEMILMEPKDARGYLGLLRLYSYRLRGVTKSQNPSQDTIRRLRIGIDTCFNKALSGKITGATFGGDRQSLLNNTLSSVYYEVGRAKYALKEYNLAIDYLDKGKEMMPDNYNIYNMLAYCYLALKDNRKAEEFIKQAIDLQPNDGALWDTYAEIMATQNKDADFYYCFDRVCRMTKDKNHLRTYSKDIRWSNYQSKPEFLAILKRHQLVNNKKNTYNYLKHLPR